MKPVNLLSLLAVYHANDPLLFKQYTDYNSIGMAQNGIREAEMEDLSTLISDMLEHKAYVDIFDNFYLGYSIPQIGKEFDLLRLGRESVINLEIKKTANFDKIEKQLHRNAYYLSFLPQKKKRLYTYVCDTHSLYKWDGSTIKEHSLDSLIETIDYQGHYEITDINSLFNPTNYLVSPFNSPDKFIERKYFLTKQQEEIKTKVCKSIDPHQSQYLAITGKPGTGKTLLIYDIVCDLVKVDLNVLIIHCASLNNGQLELINEYGWDIIGVKDVNKTQLSDYDVIVIDEAQRIHASQLQSVINIVNNQKITCIFSYDAQQFLSYRELRMNNAATIELLSNKNIYTLTEKIRTNKEVAEFIGRLYNRHFRYSINRYPNVSISYFDKAKNVQATLSMLKDQGWTVPKFTPSNYNSFKYESYCIQSTPSAHQVIGQEFDRVVAIIDSDFYYNEDGKLVTLQNYDDRIYSKYGMLYQIISRTRLQLHIVFFNNPQVFQHCLSILNH